ncbi:MAG: HTH domain-containing protein [Phycisphaeraceae bacterium]|nr:HTH domain-containing protein [Phycisphaeraceae bacterium]
MRRPRTPTPPTDPSSPAAQNPHADLAEGGGMERSLELLAKVRAGTLSGKMLGAAERQSLVALLAADGLSGPEIAQILQVSDRTVERDRRDIRDRHALPRDPKLVGQMAGRLLAEAELSIQRIRRTSREREIEPNVKIDAEHRCFQIVDSALERLQKLGYLPTAATRLQADLTHHAAEVPSSEDLEKQVAGLRELVSSQGQADPALFEAIGSMSSVLERARVATEIKRVENTAKSE